MASVLTSPELVVNAALTKLGYSLRVNDILDGSDDAQFVISVYSEVRDALLRSSTWDFAKKTAALVTSGQAAPVPWSYSYTYPADCVGVRNVYLASAQTADLNDPQPRVWSIANDPVAGTVILANDATATIVYTARVTNPAQWDSLFADTFVDDLAEAISGRYNKDFLKAIQEMEARTRSAAELIVG